MIDPASMGALRRARESAQAVEPTRYDAPPGEPDVYPSDEYPPGFGPAASEPTRQFQIRGFTIAMGASLQIKCPWQADYVYIALDKTASVEIAVYTSNAQTANWVALVGAGGHAKIPCNPLNPPEYWIYATGATARGVYAFTKGCDYENGY